MGTLAPHLFEQQKQSALAPDGLPWPPGYFDRMPRETFEEALQHYGVRPHHYMLGWPVYTSAETTRPDFINTIPRESLEIEARWAALWEASHRSLNCAEAAERALDRKRSMCTQLKYELAKRSTRVLAL